MDGNRRNPIAARIDSEVWAARFNKYAKRYRIGISTFGRSAVVSGGSPQVYGDLIPFAEFGVVRSRQAHQPRDLANRTISADEVGQGEQVGLDLVLIVADVRIDAFRQQPIGVDAVTAGDHD